MLSYYRIWPIRYPTAAPAKCPQNPQSTYPTMASMTATAIAFAARLCSPDITFGGVVLVACGTDVRNGLLLGVDLLAGGTRPARFPEGADGLDAGLFL